MARNSFMSTIVLTIDNKNAKDMLADLEKSMLRAKKELAELQEKLNNPQSWSSEDSVKSLQKREKELQRTIKSYESALGQGVSQRKGIDEVLSDLSKADYNELTSVRSSLTAAVKNLDQSSKKYKEMLAKLQQVRDEIAKRDIDVRGSMTEGRAREVMGSLDESSYADIKNATDTMKKMQAQLEPGTNKWKTYGKQIADATNYLKKWDDQAKRTQMLQATKTDLGKMSDSDLQQQLRYWDGIVNGIGRTNIAVTQYRKVLETLRAEQNKRSERVVTQVVDNNKLGGSIAEMQQRLKILQDYRNTLKTTDGTGFKRVDEAIEKLTQKIKESQAGFMSFQDAMTKASNLDNFNGTLEDLEKIQKVIKEGMNNELNLSDQDDIDRLKQAQLLLDDISKKQKEMANINAQEKVDAVSSNISGSSPAEIEEAIRLAKELQKTNGTSGKQYMELSEFIERAEARLKQWNDEVKRSSMENQLYDVTILSKSAIEEQKKYWQAMVDGTSAADIALDKYKDNLKKVTEEETRRTKDAAQQTMTEYNTGNWEKTIGETKEAIKQLQEYRNTLKTVGQPDELKELDKVIDGLTQKTKQAEAGFMSFQDALTKASDLDHFNGTLEDLEKIQKVIKEGMNNELNLSDQDDIDRLKQAQLLLDDISKKQKEMANINAQEKVDAVSSNLGGSSVGEIEEAIKLAKELQTAYAGDSTEYKKLSKFIEDGTAKLQQWNDAIRKTTMENQFLRLTSLSKNALEEQLKYWQGVFDNAEKGTAQYIQAERKLAAIRQETTNRESTQAGAVMGNLKDYSVAEIEEAIKVTEKLRDAQKAGSSEYDLYAEEIKKAKEYLQEYIDLNKQIDMEDKWGRLKTLSTDALSEQKKYWQEMVNGAKQGTGELADYEAKLKAVVKEERKRLDNQSTKVINDPTSYSVKEVQDAIKAYEQLRDAQRTGSGEWEYYHLKIEETRATLKKYNDEAKKTAMENRLLSVDTASTASLAEQKKYWQEMVDGAEKGTQALKDYQDNLSKVTAEERTRLQDAAKQTINDYNTGNWEKTIGETKEAIKQLQEYRNTLNAKNDSSALEEVDRILSELTQKTKEAEQGYLSMSEALSKAGNLNNFEGTIEDLEKLKKRLEEIRGKEIKLEDPDSAENLKQIDEALSDVGKKLDEVKNGYIDLTKLNGDLKDMSLKDLKHAASLLKKEIENCSEQMDDFTNNAEALRNVNAQIERMEKEMQRTENVIVRTAKRLASYILVYAGFNEVWGKIKQVVSANLELSDSFADIQKTTGLTSEAVAELSQSIDSIDTRTSQQQLHELAAVAGQIGLKATDDILGFVKASNMITVSLNELGSEGTASLMKLAQLTGDVKKMGVEKSLLSIGSAINELSANSAATAGPIVDLMNRMGGIASQSNITTAELAAIGATADAIGQSMEITSTSMNKFIATLLSNTDQIAYSLNMDAKALKELIDNGQTMEAMLSVFERMGEMGGISALAPIMGDLGSEGARMTQLLSAMAKNVGFLREQVDLSRESFDEATSIQNEYNVKNENAIALLERMGNTLAEMWVNSSFVEGLTWVLKQLNSLVNWFAEGSTGARILKGTLEALGITILLAASHFDKFAKALFTANTYTGMLTKSWEALTKALKANWISMIVGLLTTLAYELLIVGQRVSELVRVSNEYNAELDRENNIMKSLFNGAQNENLTKKEKSKIISEINKRYGKYLGFVVSERDSVRELAAAYDLANAKMRESMATRMGSKQMEILDEEYGEQMTEDRKALMSTLEEGRGTAGREKEAMSVIRRITMDNLDKEVKDIRVLISNEFNRLFGHSSAFASTEIKNYIETQKEYYKEFSLVNEQAAQDLEQAQKATAEANVKVMDEMFNQVQELSSGIIKAEADGPFKNTLDIQRGIVQEGEQFIDYATKNIDSLTGEQRAKVEENIKLVQKQMDEARKKLPETDAWGKELNLEGWKNTLDNLPTASLDSLIKTYKELRDAPKLISDVVKYNRMFGTSFTSLSEVMEDTHGKAEQIKNQLASMGRTTTGDFLWGGSGSDNKSAKKKAQEEYKAAIAALEAYFNERETLVRQKGMEEGKTQVQINQELERLETEKLNDEIQLRKLLLEEYYKESTFDPKKYKGVISGTDYFKEKNLEYLNELRVQLEKWGVAMEDGMKKQLTDRMVKLSEQALKLREKINKILLQDDFNEQVSQQYLDSLQELGLLFGLTESEMTKTSEKEGERRLAYMREWANESYNLNAKQLQDKVEQETALSQWRIGRTAEDYEALLIQLRKFHDDSEEADRKAAERRKKIFDNSEQGRQLEKDNQQKINKEENEGEMWDRFRDLDLVSEDTTDKAQIDVYQAKIDASRAYIEQIKLEMQAEIERAEANVKAQQATLQALEMMGIATDEQRGRLKQAQANLASLINQQGIIIAGENEKINENQKQAADRYMAIEQRKVQEAKKYTDAIVEFSGQMGEAAFGEVEDRQEAGKQLIKSLLTTLKDWIQVKTTELVMQQLFSEQSTALKGQETVKELNMTASKTTADITAGTASATAKEAGSKGFIGLAVGAAIGAALSALLGLAMGALNKSKAEVQSISGTSGRLATGMLTYAEGNYPVLGNDGQVYNAKYEGSEMKTGIYRGGAHFGIFSEKKPEAIIDGDTTQRLIMNHPDIWKAIVTLSKNGRIDRGMRTFASGNINEITRQAQDIEATATADSSAQMAQMQATMAATQQALAQLTQVLANGIKANINMYGEDGMYKNMKKAEKYAGRVGYK